jgi:hypothetical protein
MPALTQFKMSPKLTFLTALTFLLGMASCRLTDKPHWDTQWTAPLLQSEIRLMDALGDTSFLDLQGDNTINIVLRDTIVDFRIGQFISIPDTSLQATVNLDSIRLTSDTVSQRTTLHEATRGTPYEFLVDYWHNIGYANAQVPGFVFTSLDPYPVDASQYFDWAVLESGDLWVQIQNEFPMDINRVKFDLRNASDQSVVATVIFDTIPEHAIAVEVVSLAGQYMESSLEAVVDTMEFADIDSGHPIDKYQQFLELKVLLREMIADSAKAVFPAQNIIDQKTRIKWDFGEDEIALRRLELASGRLEVTAYSNIGNPMEFIYRLPSARKNGLPVEVISYLPAGSDANPSQYSTVFDLSGYSIDLTINGDSVNLFPQEFLGKLEYTGQTVIMSQSSKIDISYKLLDLEPRYVEGYLGQHAFSFGDTLALDVFDGVLGGFLDLVKPTAQLVVENSIGLDGLMKFNTLRGFNSRTGDVVDLSGQEIDGGMEITGPRLPNVGNVSRSSFALNANNSNLRDFFRLLPDEIRADIAVDANYNGVPGLLNNFATDESAIRAYLDIEVPLHGVANNLFLEQEFPFSLTNIKLPDKVEEAEFKLVIQNYFPIGAAVQMYFHDANAILVDSLFSKGAQRLNPAQTDANLLVTEPGLATLTAQIDPAKLQRIQTAQMATVRVILNTGPGTDPVKLYADAKLSFNLVGEFKYGL